MQLTCSLGARDDSLANDRGLKDAWSLDVIPVLAGEWINDLLLRSLFAFGKALVFPEKDQFLSL